MILIAGLFALLSYQNLYFGLDQLGGGNNGYWSLLIPGRFQNVPNDKGQIVGGAAASSAAAPGTGTKAAPPTAAQQAVGAGIVGTTAYGKPVYGPPNPNG